VNNRFNENISTAVGMKREDLNLCIKLKLHVCVCVCVRARACSLAARERIYRSVRCLTCLFPEPGRDFRKVKTPKIVFNSSPGEGGSRSSETEQDRKTAPRSTLFVSSRILLKQGHKHEILPWV
jgi:hypothetical protein